MMPFILLGRKKIPPESPPSDEHIYDSDRQLWIERNTGLPLVSCMREQAQPTQFGETTLTETREGADRAEGIALHATQYGETSVTATREGLDQTDRAIQTSQLGETTFTRTREGADQSEAPAVQASQLGETTLTKTREGADQSEGATLPVSHAAYSHF
jgi:hypothetical protein